MTTSSPDPAKTGDDAARDRAWAQEFAHEALSGPTYYFQVDGEWKLFHIETLREVLSDEQEALLSRSLADSFLSTTEQDHAAAVALAQPVLAFAINANTAVVVKDNAVIAG